MSLNGGGVLLLFYAVDYLLSGQTRDQRNSDAKPHPSSAPRVQMDLGHSCSLSIHGAMAVTVESRYSCRLLHDLWLTPPDSKRKASEEVASPDFQQRSKKTRTDSLERDVKVLLLLSKSLLQHANRSSAGREHRALWKAAAENRPLPRKGKLPRFGFGANDANHQDSLRSWKSAERTSSSE